MTNKRTPDISGVLTRSTHPTFLDKDDRLKPTLPFVGQARISQPTYTTRFDKINVTQAYTIVVWYDKYDSRLYSGLHYRGLVR